MIPTPHAAHDLDRRGLLRMSRGLAGTLAMLLSMPAGALLSGCAAHDPGAADQPPLLGWLADAVLPPTQTPGAGTPANVAFVLRAVQAGLMGVAGDLVTRLAAELDASAGQAFLTLPDTRRLAIVEQMDRQVFGESDAVRHPWFAIKALILMSYYTSEAGMTQELRYALVPGDYQGDVHVDARWRATSSDWSAVAIKKALHP
jgi:hypothetical protein